MTSYPFFDFIMQLSLSAIMVTVAVGLAAFVIYSIIFAIKELKK